MHPLPAKELLDAWERALPLPQPEQSLALLAASARTAPERLARLSVGQLNSRLLTLREWTFGERMTALAECPACGERLELTLGVADLRAEPEGETRESLSLKVEEYEAEFRLPNTFDLLALRGCEGVEEASARLLERCLLGARRGGVELAAVELPREVVEALAERMGEADPQADAQLALDCTRCGHGWLAAFDIASFFWEEVHAWARRTLGEVHALARAYGWPEQEILGMSAWRRRLYLGMLGGQGGVPAV